MNRILSHAARVRQRWKEESIDQGAQFEFKAFGENFSYRRYDRSNILNEKVAKNYFDKANFIETWGLTLGSRDLFKKPKPKITVGPIERTK